MEGWHRERSKMEVLDKEMKERIIVLYKEMGMSQADLARAINTSSGNLSTILNGHDKGVSATIIVGISKIERDINMNWVLKGTGEMFMSKISDRESELESQLIRSKDLVESLERMILKR